MSTTRYSEQAQDIRDDSADDGPEDFEILFAEVSDSVESYCRRRPGIVAGVLFGLGFYCGWRLRLW